MTVGARRDYSTSWNETYGLDRDPVRTNLIFPLVKARVAEVKHDYVADLGCGNGSMINVLLDIDFKSLVGIDLNEGFLRYAREHVVDERVRIETGDIVNENPIQTGSIDVALAIFVLNEIAEIDRFFVHCRRILAPLGRLLLVMTHPFVPLYWRLLEKYQIRPNEKILNFQNYFNREICEYRFTLSGDTSTYVHHNFEMIAKAVKQADLRIETMRELATDSPPFASIQEYWSTRDIPKFLYLEISR